ncbi:hypothetical protein NDU88_002751 [Pleurodeles waltl]|uniref:Uncharacterized protein n=1 Tax=Pleurodeles waltl TaxID=8319 RepID=A0AAV7T3S8_PLEWA|nr:hypothetical protein NDU88_002751 [Pleurodeles waltl]
MIRTEMDQNKSVANGALPDVKMNNPQCTTGGSLEATLAAQSQRFDEILMMVIDVKSTLKPKIIVLQIDMDIFREGLKKLQDRVINLENYNSEP